MPDVPIRPPRDGRRPLTRDQIVAAAIDYVDDHGLAALTMRRLGESLSVEAMSLYYHLNGREDLLEAMVGHLTESVRIPADAEIGQRDGWQGYMQQLAHTVRAMAVQHPKLFPLVATRPPAAPWLRPPLRSLGLVEDFLAALLHRGVSEEHTVLAYKMFSSFLLGHLLLEIATSDGGSFAASPEQALNEGDADHPTPDEQQPLEDYPTVAHLRQALSRHDPDADFERGLEVLLDQLDLVISR